MDYSYPPSHRLSGDKQFSPVFKKGQRLRQGSFFATALKTNHPVARLGMTIGRKAAPRAVDRNRLKRQVRESFRHSGLSGMDIVIGARFDAKQKENDSLRRDLDRLWQQLLAEKGPMNSSRMVKDKK